MKVAMTFPGCHRRGGVERVVLECAQFLSGRGHEVTVLANEWDDEGGHPIRFQHVRMQRRPSFLGGPSYFRSCSRALEAARSAFDVVSTHGVTCPLGGVHLVHSVHRAWLERSRELRAPLSLDRIKQRLNPLHPILLHLEALHFRGRNYRKLIALTRDVKADLMRFYDVPEEDIVIVPNGFAPTEFNYSRTLVGRAPMRQKLGYDKDDKVVIFVANELERKGFGPLVRALARFDDPNVHLLAVGRLDARKYEREIHGMGLAGRVRFTGPAQDVAQYYAAADVFALPTQYEAWGLVIVEALACGVPVLTSRLAGAAVAVREGDAGQLLDDPQDVDEISRKLRLLLQGTHVGRDEISASVDDYRAECVLARFEEVLADCVAEPVAAR